MDPDGNFIPRRSVRYSEAMAMTLIRAAHGGGAALLLGALVTAFIGCDARRASWNFTFAENSLKTRAAVVEARILADGCSGSRVLYETSIDPSTNATSPEELTPGTYGFFGRAGDVDCRWFAEGCVEKTLPLDEEESISVRLLEIQQQIYCYTGTCVDGLCIGEEQDSGPDADEAEAGPDADQDGQDDADVPPQPPAVPRPLLPMNGWATGSVWAPNSHPNHRPLRPTFTWMKVNNAQRYEIQIEDNCPATDFSSCDFDSPVLTDVVMDSFGAYFEPVSNLEADTTAPVGKRYFWRLRACNDVGCSNWSRPRYVDVGRLPNDFNGDGYSDAAIASLDFRDTLDEEGAVFVFGGSDSGLRLSADQLSSPSPRENGQFGSTVAVAGDVNADGFSDLVVGNIADDLVVVFNGSEDGLSNSDVVTITGDEDADFGFDVAGAGDVNGDGFADIVVGAQSSGGPAGQSFVYAGSSDSVITAPLSVLENPGNGQLGHDVAGVGDVNGDGFADVLVGAYLNVPSGQAFIYNGSDDGPDSVPSVVLDNPLSVAGGRFGIAVSAAGDINGDGFWDVMVSDYLWSDPLDEEGVAFLFLGNSSGLIAECFQVISSPNAEESGFFGWRMASAGDVDRDGLGDVLIGATREQSAVTADNAGRAYLLFGSEDGLVDELIFDNPDEIQMNAGYGLSLANGGDVDGDGFTDLIIGAPLQNEARGHAYVYSVAGETIPTTPTLTVESPTPQPGAQFAYSLETGLAP